MAYTKDYTYDIFISYAHIDNQQTSGKTRGWIEKFYAELNLSLLRRIGTYKISFWWDEKRLDGSIEFNPYINEAIQKSAIMICLVSPAYLQSDYCRKELQSFYNKASHETAGLHPGNRNRIINVLMNDIPYTEWPGELAGATGFKFNDAKEDGDFGDTLKTNTKAFEESLKNLREAIKKILDELNKVIIPDDKFRIFIGDVSDSLSVFKKRVINDLKSHKEFEIVYDIPPPYEETEHENIVKQSLQNIKLSVHLLDQYPGREIEGRENISYPQKQIELSLSTPQTQLIWVPLDMNIDTVEDEQYKLFLTNLETGKESVKNIKYIRGIKSELTQQIIDVSNKILAEEKKPSAGKLSILLDTHYSDQLYAYELSKQLVEKGIQPYINPEEDDPKKNITILEDRIAQVNKLVFFYGKVSSYWISERINAAMQLMVSNSYSKKDFYVFMIPPHKTQADVPPFESPYLPINIINCSDAMQLDSATMQLFFKSINAVT